MEVIRISNQKLKVMLSDEDMRHYEIQSCSKDYGDAEIRRALSKILFDADKETDFNVAKDRIYIEIFPDKDGGCEMFVTKLGEREKKEARGKTQEKRLHLYIFPDIPTLLLICKKLHAAGYTGESFAYKDEKNSFCLLLYERPGNNFSADKGVSEYAFLTEYGKRKNGVFSVAYVREHGSLISEKNAIETLALL